MKQIFEDLQEAISVKLNHLLWMKDQGVEVGWDDGKSLDHMIKDERRAYENVTSALDRLSKNT